MMPYILVIATIFIIAAATNAFTAVPQVGAIHRSLSSSTSSLSSGYLDGIFYESTQTYEEDMIIALYHNESVTVSDMHIFNSILKVTGMAAGEIYSTMVHSKGLAKVAELDTWPRQQAELYYEQLLELGVPVFLC